MGRADNAQQEQHSRMASGRRRPAGPSSCRSSGFAARILRARRAAACLLALGLALTLAAGAAQAQSSVTLVSNTGQQRSTASNFTTDHAQAFTTGNHAGGYKLTRVDLDLSVTGTAPTFSVSIRSDSGGSPGTSLGTLTHPTSFSTGSNSFTASGTGIDLAAGTTYWVVIDVSGSSNHTNFRIDLTLSDAEDAGAAAGWSIADTARLRSAGSSGAWQSFTSSRQIAIRGHEKLPTVTGVAITSDPGTDRTYRAGDRIRVTVTFSVPVTVTGTPHLLMHFSPSVAGQRNRRATYWSGSGTNRLVFDYAVAATDDTGTGGIGLPANGLELNGGTIRSGSADATLTYAAVDHDTSHRVRPSYPSVSNALVGNIVEPQTSRIGFDNDMALEFDTGPHAHGYRVTHVDVALERSGAVPAHTVSIRRNSAANLPGDVVVTLTTPALATGAQAARYAAPAGGIDLDRSTRYWVVIDVTGVPSATVLVSRTDRDTHDPGAAAGWSIGNFFFHRAATSTGSWTTHTQIPKLAIHGYAKASRPGFAGGGLVSNTGQPQSSGALLLARCVRRRSPPDPTPAATG